MNSITSTISSLWTSNDKRYFNIAKPEILKLGNILNSVFTDTNLLKKKVPRIAVIGSQSSGKSSVLNGILSMDILPMGKNMVTRVPLNLQLIQSDMMKAEFGNYINVEWKVIKTVVLTDPLPTKEEVEQIRKQIEAQTIDIAGSSMDIGFQEINLKIYSPHVPDLSLIDLPGLTMVACTDKGQPKDIKTKIRKLLNIYVEDPNTILLAVMPARVDLETDMALDLIKEHDPNGQRTIGVLTKVDLMDQDTTIAEYFTNTISKDLQLKYGYFAVRNRNNNELKAISIFDGFKKEEQYFKKHKIYSNIPEQNRLGINNLSNNLSDILVNKIKNSLPDFLKCLLKKEIDIKKKMDELGDPLPDTNEAKLSYIHQIVNTFIKSFSKAVNDRCADINTGRQIRDIFMIYRQELLNSENKFQHLSDDYYRQALLNCEGNHMSFSAPPVEVLENCIRTIKPFTNLSKKSQQCVKDVSIILIELADELLDKYSRFPLLKSKMKDIIAQRTITPILLKTNRQIDQVLKLEENYIWTDDPEFLGIMNGTYKAKNEADYIKHMLTGYYRCIVKNINHNIPKIIMYYFILEIEKNLSNMLFAQMNNLTKLLQENNEVHKKRMIYKTYLTKIKAAKELIEKI